MADQPVSSEMTTGHDGCLSGPFVFPAPLFAGTQLPPSCREPANPAAQLRCLKIFFFSAKQWFVLLFFLLLGNTTQSLAPTYLTKNLTGGLARGRDGALDLTRCFLQREILSCLVRQFPALHFHRSWLAPF